ncbi:flagellar type III secretion system protein FliQ [Candidatus Peregrinibacteria bacterium]|nr:flagellar type III secretion system protein FliQ [Candidatus Peregrinibacteria bacterium]
MGIAIDLGREALVVAIKISLPLLLTGLLVGVIISVLQAATQVQEQTLALIPKIAMVVATLYIIMPWLIQVLVDYTQDLFLKMAVLLQ